MRSAYCAALANLEASPQTAQPIATEADRASSILRQLLASSRDSGPDRRPIDLNPLILRTVELQRFQLTSEKTRLELDLSSALPLVLCAGWLQRILMNLISNARHALLGEKAAGVIRVRTRTADSGHVILEISDSGPGIPEARRQQQKEDVSSRPSKEKKAGISRSPNRKKKAVIPSEARNLSSIAPRTKI